MELWEVAAGKILSSYLSEMWVAALTSLTRIINMQLNPQTYLESRRDFIYEPSENVGCSGQNINFPRSDVPFLPVTHVPVLDRSLVRISTETPVILVRCCFPQSLQANAEKVAVLDEDRLLPDPHIFLPVDAM
jgi:hypothetical protein